jgi:transposase-like protein
MSSSKDSSSQSENFEFNNYKSLVSAEIELIQRVFEIRQNFLNSPDSERIVEPILQRISKIRSEKLILEKKFNLLQ